MGYPFFAGFYSKDLILELAFSRVFFSAEFIYSLGIIAAIFTAIYSIRLIIYLLYLRSSSAKTLIVSHLILQNIFLFFVYPSLLFL